MELNSSKHQNFKRLKVPEQGQFQQILRLEARRNACYYVALKVIIAVIACTLLISQKGTAQEQYMIIVTLMISVPAIVGLLTLIASFTYAFLADFYSIIEVLGLNLVFAAVLSSHGLGEVGYAQLKMIGQAFFAQAYIVELFLAFSCDKKFVIMRVIGWLIPQIWLSVRFY